MQICSWLPLIVYDHIPPGMRDEYELRAIEWQGRVDAFSSHAIFRHGSSTRNRDRLRENYPNRVHNFGENGIFPVLWRAADCCCWFWPRLKTLTRRSSHVTPSVNYVYFLCCFPLVGWKNKNHSQCFRSSSTRRKFLWRRRYLEKFAQRLARK